MMKNLCNKINTQFNQENMPELNKPYKIGEYIVFFWSCGAIALQDSFMWFINEDDGYWFIGNDPTQYKSSAWIPSIIECLNACQKYLEDNGKSYCYKDTNIHCGYNLEVN